MEGCATHVAVTGQSGCLRVETLSEGGVTVAPKVVEKKIQRRSAARDRISACGCSGILSVVFVVWACQPDTVSSWHEGVHKAELDVAAASASLA